MKKTTLFLKKQKYAAYWNEWAFTLVEMMFAFSLFWIIVFFISPLLHLILNHHELPERIQDLQWQVFCSQVKKEIRMSTKVQVLNGSLILTEDAGTAIFEKYENSLRRRVNETGHEILLQNVSNASFELLGNAVKITIKDLNQKVYTVVAYSFLDWGGSS